MTPEAQEAAKARIAMQQAAWERDMGGSEARDAGSRVVTEGDGVIQPSMGAASGGERTGHDYDGVGRGACLVAVGRSGLTREKKLMWAGFLIEFVQCSLSSSFFRPIKTK